MEIKDMLKRENCEVIESVEDWRDAVEKGTKKLIEGGYITHQYTEAIMKNAEEFDAYFVLCPGIALLHASSTEGVNETQLSLTYVKKPFKFDGKDDEVTLMITLCANKGDDHMNAIQQIAILLSDEETLNKALNTPDADKLFEIFTSVKLG